MSRPWIAVVALAACTRAPMPAPADPPAAPVVTPAPKPEPDPVPVDPRLEELARTRDASALPAANVAPADPPADAALLRAGADDTIADLALPPGAAVYLAVRRPDASPALAWLRARPLEQPRCAAWLGVTRATVADVVRAVADHIPESDEDLARDPRVCGTSWLSRLDALRAGGGSLYVRADAEGVPACARLTFAPDGSLVREGDGRHPTLRFELTAADDQLVLAGPRTCKATSTAYEWPTSIVIERKFSRGMAIENQRRQLYYAEATCLAGDAPAHEQPDCVGSLLASTSSKPDEIVDRVAPIAAKKGALYDPRDRCAGTRFATTSWRDSLEHGTRSVTYDGFAIHVVVESLDNSMGSGDVFESILPVVHTNEDHVLVDGQRWYFTRKACQRASAP